MARSVSWASTIETQRVELVRNVVLLRIDLYAVFVQSSQDITTRFYLFAVLVYAASAPFLLLHLHQLANVDGSSGDPPKATEAEIRREQVNDPPAEPLHYYRFLFPVVASVLSRRLTLQSTVASIDHRDLCEVKLRLVFEVCRYAAIRRGFICGCRLRWKHTLL